MQVYTVQYRMYNQGYKEMVCKTHKTQKVDEIKCPWVGSGFGPAQCFINNAIYLTILTGKHVP